jgi:hypothetical protein
MTFKVLKVDFARLVVKSAIEIVGT